MTDPGDNGDGAPGDLEVEDVKVEEVAAAGQEKPEERELLEQLVIGLLRRGIHLVGTDDETCKVRLSKEERLELKELGTLIGRVGNFLFPKLAAVHQLTDNADSFFARMRATFTVDDAKKALAAQQRRIERARASGGRPPKAEIVDPHDR